MEDQKASIPEAFRQNTQKILGDTYSDFEKSLDNPSPISIRYNPIKSTDEKLSLEPVLWSSEGVYLNNRPVFTLDPYFQAGSYYVQEASSMFIEHVYKQTCSEKNGIKALDLCAAPGGKSTHLISLLDKESLLISNEVIKSRVSILEQNMAKWGYSNCFITNNDPEDFSSLDAYFDLMLVDAPCSGEGMFRKNIHAREEWSIENVNLCASRQQRILNDVLNCLKPGGIFIYSTCTFNEKENENNLEWILDQESEIESVQINCPESWNIVESTFQKNNQKIYSYRFYPHRINGEGFFCAVFKKKECDLYTTWNKNYKFKNKHWEIPKKQIPIVEKWLENASDFSFINFNNELFAIQKNHLFDFDKLQKQLNIRIAGISLGKIMHEDFVPSHQLALSVDISKNIQTVSVNLEQALLFMKKEDINLEKTPQKGWALINYKGLNLGWVKILNNRINNYYPKEWRIRMALDRNTPDDEQTDLLI